MLARIALSALLALTSHMTALAQASTKASAPSRSLGELRSSGAIQNFVFISRQADGWRQYAPRQTPVFRVGEALQFYAEPVNLGWSPKGASYRFDMRVDVEIRTADGTVVWGQRDYGQLSQERAEPDPNTFITGSIAIKGLAPGLYLLGARFRDPANGRTVETELAFAIAAESRAIDA